MATNQPEWHVDHTVLDVIVTDRRTGKNLGRPKLIVEIDSYTRRVKRIDLEYPDDTQNGSDGGAHQLR